MVWYIQCQKQDKFYKCTYIHILSITKYDIKGYELVKKALLQCAILPCVSCRNVCVTNTQLILFIYTRMYGSH